MVITKGTRNVATGAVFGVILLAGCAGGESDTVGAVNLSGGLSQGGATGTPTTGMPQTGTSGSPDDTTLPETTGPQPTTASSTDPVTASGTSDGDTDPTGAFCMFAEDCEDDDPCTEDNCVNSACSNTAVDCDDGVACTMDACNPATGACINTPDDAACDDGDLCTGVETCNGGLGCVEGEPVMCTDLQACTADSCIPATGMCTFQEITMCNAGDGCCPLGCSVADTDCTCTNLALAATPTSSGGGSNGTGYGPLNWTDGNDEDACPANCFQCFGWIDNGPSPTGAWMQLEWASSQVIGSMFVDGIAAGGCQATSRGLAGGTVQWWNGAGWVDAQTFSGASGDVEFTFDPPLQTTRLRIFNAVTPPGGSNSLMFEWYVYEPLGCTP